MKVTFGFFFDLDEKIIIDTKNRGFSYDESKSVEKASSYVVWKNDEYCDVYTFEKWSDMLFQSWQNLKKSVAEFNGEREGAYEGEDIFFDADHINCYISYEQAKRFAKDFDALCDFSMSQIENSEINGDSDYGGAIIDVSEDGSVSVKLGVLEAYSADYWFEDEDEE